MFTNNIIVAQTLNDAWREAMWCCVRNGVDYKVTLGSYEGQIRRQLPYAIIIIEEPKTRPFNFYTPAGIPPPTTEEKINDYFNNYLSHDTKCETEDYTYGQYIVEQLPSVINKLNSSEGDTNQACITVGDFNSIDLPDPPCLKVIDFKKVDNQLNMSVFFRSWDLFAGLPENLGGLQLLKELVLLYLNFPIEDGKMIAFSSGLHLYEQYFSLVDQMNIDKVSAKEEKA